MATLTQPSHPTTEVNVRDETFEVVQTYPHDIIACASVYLSVFERPPFSDIWQVQGEKIPALLNNPQFAMEFLQRLLEVNPAPIRQADGSEIFQLEKSFFLNLANSFLTSKSTDLLSSGEEPWITDEEKAELLALMDLLELDDSEILEIRANYPITKVLESYFEDARNEGSYITVSGINMETLDPMSFRINQDTRLPTKGFLPLSVGRIRSMGENRENQFLVLREELSHYMNEEEIQKLYAELGIQEATRVAFLAEIAKLKCNITKNSRASAQMTSGFLSEVVGKDIEKLPAKLVFFTFEGTKTRTPGLLRKLINQVLKMYEIGKSYESENWIVDASKKSPDLKVCVMSL